MQTDGRKDRYVAALLSIVTANSPKSNHSQRYNFDFCLFLLVSPTINHIQTALKSTDQRHMLWPGRGNGCACRIFYAVLIYIYQKNSVDVLSCPVLPSRQWRRHIWHPVSCLFLHFNIHLTYSLYSIKLIQLQPKLNLRFFSIRSFLGFQHTKYPTFFVCISVAISVNFASFSVPGCISRNIIRCIRQDIALCYIRGLQIWSHKHSTSRHI